MCRLVLFFLTRKDILGKFHTLRISCPRKLTRQKMQNHRFMVVFEHLYVHPFDDQKCLKIAY